MFSFVLPKRNLTHMLDEVNMKSNQREHQSIQVKEGGKLVASFAKNFNVYFCSGVGGEMEQKWGEMNEGSKGSLIGFLILFSYPVPSERINF